MYCSTKPYYSDPDARAARALVSAASILSEAGLADEAERHAATAAALFEGVPYDKKKRAKVLGDVRYLPNGIIAVMESDAATACEIPAPPYGIDQDEDRAAVLASARKKIRDQAVRAALSGSLGWPASSQLGAAIMGTSLRASGRTLAKALSVLAPAVDAMQAAGWSESAMAMFRNAAEKSGLLQSEALGAREARYDVRSLVRRGTLMTDDGEKKQDGGWIAWLPPDVLERLAADIVARAGNQAPDWHATCDAISSALDSRRAAWFPGIPCAKIQARAEAIGREAVEEAAVTSGIPVAIPDYVASSFESAAESALMHAMRAKAMFEAALIFQDASDRDEDTADLFRHMGILPKNGIPAHGGARWFGGIAAAVACAGRYAWSWAYSGPNQAAPDEVQEAFVRRAEDGIRSHILEWSRTPEAEEVFTLQPGAYYNCPVTRDGPENK